MTVLVNEDHNKYVLWVLLLPDSCGLMYLVFQARLFRGKQLNGTE